MLNQFLQKNMALLTLMSLIIGVLIHNIGIQFLFVVPFLFGFMTFVGSLSMRLTDLKVFVTKPGAILLSLLILHVIMPLLAYLIASLIFEDHLIVIGFVMLMAVPTGVTSVIWINVTRGDLPLGLSIILIDTLMAPFILPFILKLVSGTSIELDVLVLMKGLFLMIVLPTVLGIVVNELSKGAIPKKIAAPLAPFSKISLFLIIMINSSAVAPYVKTVNMELILIVVMVFITVMLGYAISALISRLKRSDYPTQVTFTFICGMRNISTGVILATTYFPKKVAMPVVLGMLFQQALASLFSKFLLRIRP